MCLSCSLKDKRASATTNTDTQSITAEEIEMIVNTLNSFLKIDEVKLAQQEQLYLQLLNSTEENPSEEDKHWYSKNIVHVDSVCKQANSLLMDKRYDELLILLEEELGNLQSHPNADTYLCYDLTNTLAILYYHSSKDKMEWLPILADHLELNRVQINAAQSGWDKPHPLYKSVLEDLLAIYEQLGNQAKAVEMRELLAKLEK